jgi:hypothetical protein
MWSWTGKNMEGVFVQNTNLIALHITNIQDIEKELA